MDNQRQTSPVQSEVGQTIPAHDSISGHVPSSFKLDHVIRDPDLIHDILHYPEGRIREDYINTCLRIGALALKQAEGQVDANAIRNEGEHIMAELAGVLNGHRQSVTDQMANTLKDYFDPESGRLDERLSRLLKGGGELEQVMRGLVGAEDSEIAKTLALHIGESSPLIKILDPESSGGVIQNMSNVLNKALAEDSERIISEFSLDKPESALNRFLKELGDNQGKLTGQLQENIKTVVDEFSLDKEDSALSRLVRQVDTAQKQISAEFTLDSDTSALARLRNEILELHNNSNDANQKLLREIHASVQSLHIRKEEAARSTTHGDEFESALYQLINNLSKPAGDMATPTGNTTGTIKNCKKGDIVVQLSPEHIAAGSNIVIEAKDDASYTMQKAIEEIDEARKNRDAQIGIFVFSKDIAPDGLTTFQRHGQNILVIWDLQDTETDLFPEVALSLARALCVQNTAGDSKSQVDLDKMNEAIRDIEKQAGYFEDITKWSETIKKNGENIINKTRTMRDKILRQVGMLDQFREDIKNIK